MERLAGIQALRFGAALMVVGAHLIPGFENIGRHGVDVFFVISGFIMVYTSEALFGQVGAPRRFLLNRLTRIVPLYWLMTLLTASIQHPTAAHTAMSLLFVPVDGLPVLSVGWSLNIEMFFYLAFSMALLVARRIAVQLVCGVLIGLVLLGLSCDLPSAIKVYWATPQMLWFVIGMLLGNAYREGLPLPGISFTGSAAQIADVLGNASYALYLTHSFVAWKIGGPIWLQAVGVIVVSIAVYYAIERPITLILRRYCGNWLRSNAETTGPAHASLSAFFSGPPS